MRNFLLPLRSALFLILLFGTVQLVSALDFEVDGLYYRVQNSSLMHVAVVGCDFSNQQEGADEWWTDEFFDVVIPETVTYNGKVYTVVRIGDEAFANSSIKSVYIPNTVMGIGTGAFRECWGLTSVTIPTSVSFLGDFAFESCGLTEVTVPSSITTLREAVFRNCYELTSIQLFNSTISSHMFEGCYGLKEVIIPDNITYIGSYAFSGCYGLTSITIPETITSIDAYTFADCMELTSITIPEAVTNIGSYAFYGCSGLTSITVPEAVTSIGSYAFYGCSGLMSITIPEAVTTIDSYVFSGCYELTSVTIHEGVTSFGEGAFEYCSKLTDVTIPASVTKIGEYAFRDCGLTSVTIPVAVKSIGIGAFKDCWQLKTVYFNAENCSVYDPHYDYNFDELPFGESVEEFIVGGNVKHIPAHLVCCAITNVTIPESVTSIGEGAFRECAQLKTVRFNATNCEDISSNSSSYDEPYCTFSYSTEEIIIGNNVKRIPAYLAKNCYNLTSITIPDAVTAIGSGAFKYCSGLQSVTIGSSVYTIGSEAFNGCTGLTSVIIDGSVLSIKDYAFYNCTGLTSVTIPESVTTIDNLAFNGCTGLTSVTIPSKVTTLGSSIFKGCTGLREVIIRNKKIGERMFSGCTGLTNVTIPESVTSIGAYAFSECTGLGEVIILNNKIGEYMFYGCTGLTSVTIPESVTSIGSGAFSSCTSLKTVYFNAKTCGDFDYAVFPTNIETFVIGDNVKRIPVGFAKGCTGLTNITIPNSVTYIGNQAFYNCTGLTSVTIGSSVITIGSSAFYGCTALTSVTIPQGVTTIRESAFSGCSALETIHFNAENCGDFTSSSPFPNSLQELTIGNGVTHIPAYLAKGFTGLTSIEIPESVTAIGDYAFSGCTGLASVTIPGAVTSIGSSAFSGCTGLTSVTIPGAVTSIGNSAFSGCTALSTVNFNAVNCSDFGSGNYKPFPPTVQTMTIGNSVTRIPAFFANGCTGLTSIEIPESVTTIGSSAFSGCTGLTSVTIPEGVTSIGNSAFSGCAALSTVNFNAVNCSDFGSYGAFPSTLQEMVIGSNVSKIPAYFAKGCTALTSVTIPGAVTSIGSYAFYGCTALTTVKCWPIEPPTLESSVFYQVPSDMIVFVPAIALEAYKLANGWSAFEILPLSDGVLNLTVNMPDNVNVTDYHLMKLGISNSDGSLASHYTITDKTSYKFSGIKKNTTWNVALTNQYGDVFGKIENVEVGEEDVSVSFASLLKPQTVTLTVKTPTGQNVTNQSTISWLDENGELLTQDKQIVGVSVGKKLTYSVTLPQELATAYSLPADMTYTVKDGTNNIVCQLIAIAQAQLSGKVKDATTNQPLYGATISATQTFAGGNTKTLTATTDGQGAYTLDALSAPTTLTIAAPGYISQTMNCDELMTGSSNITLPDVALRPITGVVVNVNLTYTPAHTEGEAAETQNWYSDYNNVYYEVYNKTTGRSITDISVQYPQIVLMEDVNDSDMLELTATSRKEAFKPVKTTVTINEQKSAATFDIKEWGKVQATFNKNINPKVTGSLYDAENKLVKTADYLGSTLTIDDLPDGNYTLITMGKSDFFNSIYDLDQFSAAGLTVDDDYVKNEVQVNSGIISQVTIPEVPFFDESKFYYTESPTSFTVSKPSIVVGNYLTFRGQVDFKEQYAGMVNDVQLIIDLPESCSFIDNTVMVGTALAGYTTSGNRIIIPISDYNAIVRFCVIPTVAGNFAPSALVKFELNGKTITQPIGSAPFTAQGLSITVPSIVADTRIRISGTAIGACEIDIYDNDVLIGHTTSLQNGTWSTQCELNNPFNQSTHRIHALVTTPQGIVLQTEIANCFYDKNAIEVDNVVMTFYNGWLHQNVSVVFDCLKGTVNPSSYQFYSTTEFTFVVNFTNNDTTIVSDVVVNVFTDHNNTRRLLAVYDENSNQWVASASFSGSDLPINVSVDYSVNSEQMFTSTHLNNVLSEAKNEYDEYVQGRNDIDQMLANAWTVIEEAGDDTDALLAAYDSFDNVISQINTIYDLGIDLQPSTEYDDLSEEELEATETEDSNRMLALLQEIEQEIENINKSYIYQEYSDFVDQQNGIAITSTTCDGLSPAYLLEHGYEVIPTENGDSIYVKFGSDTVSYVNFEENICQTIILSEIGKSMMFTSTVLELSSSEESPELIEELKVIFNKIKEKKKRVDQILAVLGRATVNSIKDDYAEMLANCNDLVGTFKELSYLVSDFVDKAKDTKLFAPLKSLQGKYKRLLNEWSLAKAHAARSKNINKKLFWKSTAARLEGKLHLTKFLLKSGKFLVRYAPVAAAAFAIAQAAEKIATVVGAASTIFPCENDLLNASRTMIYAIGIVRNIGHYAGANILVEVALDGTALATSETILGAVGFIALKYIASWGVDKVTGWHFNSKMNALYNKIGALKCQKELEPEPSEPKTPPTTPIHDPSGFVYEGVPSNRLEGVTATCYYKETVEDMYGDTHEEVVLWDAEQYGQQNPLITDVNGYYRWDVPIGMWQVKYEKEGYETTYSDWLPVPPPQLDVNIGMVQMCQPEVIKARAYPKAVEFEFDKFMFPETLNSNNITVTVNGSPVSGTIELLNAEVDDPLAITSIRRAPGTGLTFASKVRFNASSPFNADKVTLHVKKDVKSYADLEMYEDYEAVLDVELEIQSIEADSTVNILYGDSRELTVTVLPANASRGKTLSVRSVAPMLATTDAESYTLNNNGQAFITVHGDLPGMTSLLYSIEGYDLSAATLVNVMMESQMTVATPTASIASGSEVEKGTAVYLRCATEGATIYYTLDGSCPCDNTAARKVYDGSPIIINSTVTIKAMATAPDLYDSNVAIFVYRVTGGKKGDINGDGEINIADINAGIDIILGGNMSEETRTRADINGDGEINIADINALIDIILTPSNHVLLSVNCDDLLHLDDVTMRPGDVRTLLVTVDHAARYSAMQCDIVLPAGLTLVEAQAVGANTGKCGSLNESSSRALTYSMSKLPFVGDTQPVMIFTVRADAALAPESEISLTNAVLADAGNKAWRVSDCTARVNNASGINDMTATVDRVWVEGRTLFIESRQDGTAQLAMINGMVSNIPLKAGINRQRLDRGIYIVVINGQSHKIAIK